MLLVEHLRAESQVPSGSAIGRDANIMRLAIRFIQISSGSMYSICRRHRRASSFMVRIFAAPFLVLHTVVNQEKAQGEVETAYCTAIVVESKAALDGIGERGEMAEMTRSRFSLMRSYLAHVGRCQSRMQGPHILTRQGRELVSCLARGIHKVSNDPSRLGSKGQARGLELHLDRLAGVRHRAALLANRSNVARTCVELDECTRYVPSIEAYGISCSLSLYFDLCACLVKALCLSEWTFLPERSR